jgi:hypothetical protein
MDTPITDLTNYMWNVCKGRLSDQILLTPLRGRSYALIVLRFDLQADKDKVNADELCLPERFYRAITQNYRPITGSSAQLFEARHYYASVSCD